MTRYDKIQSMADKELVEWISASLICWTQTIYESIYGVNLNLSESEASKIRGWVIHFFQSGTTDKSQRYVDKIREKSDVELADFFAKAQAYWSSAICEELFKAERSYTENEIAKVRKEIIVWMQEEFKEE